MGEDFKRRLNELKSEIAVEINRYSGDGLFTLSTGERAVRYYNDLVIVGRPGGPIIRNSRDQWVLDMLNQLKDSGKNVEDPEGEFKPGLFGKFECENDQVLRDYLSAEEMIDLYDYLQMK